MRGAVAAGSKRTVDAAAWALGHGGTAVDAVVAGVLAAFVVEGPLTGPAGGGFLLLEEPGDEPIVLDCFFTVPARPPGAMEEVEIDFADASTQVFHIGEASVAVPGLVAGLRHAHARAGRLAWRELFTPAVELARSGVAVEPAQAFLHAVLVPILQRDEGGRRLYGDAEHVRTDDLVPSLELLRDDPAGALATLLPELADDLAGYTVVERVPLEVSLAGTRVLSTPAPSLGGAVVERALEVVEGENLGAPGSPDEALALARALAAGYGTTPPGRKPTGTTHISVVDARGGVAALSSTLGSGAGVFRHGFQLNNMLGELDVIGDARRAVGERLPSMMAPTVAVGVSGPRLLVGSAGSVRLAGAIAQVLASVVVHDLPVDEAISRPRLVVDGESVHVEAGWSPLVAEALAGEGWTVVEWSARNLFFGGANAVEVRPDGTTAAAGDPRRGGHGAVVR